MFFFLVAALYEGLKYFREVLHNFAMEKRKERKNRVDTINEFRADERYMPIVYITVGMINCMSVASPSERRAL